MVKICAKYCSSAGYHLFLADELLTKTQPLQMPPGNQQTRGVGSGIVGQSGLQAISWEFVRIGGSQYNISFQFGVGNLADNVFVCLNSQSGKHNLSLIW